MIVADDDPDYIVPEAPAHELEAEAAMNAQKTGVTSQRPKLKRMEIAHSPIEADRLDNVIHEGK